LQPVLSFEPNILIWQKNRQQGMSEIPLAELIIYNNFALQFGIGERKEFKLKTRYGKSQISS
jgi:hypothetical protein